jgi:hypothetical protein
MRRVPALPPGLSHWAAQRRTSVKRAIGSSSDGPIFSVLDILVACRCDRSAKGAHDG